MIPPFRVRRADWEHDHGSLRRIREDVFVHEQRVPPELEWDGFDAECHHVIAEDQHGAAIGTGRLLADGHIGRMAVLQAWRKRGVGSALLKGLLAIASEHGMREVMLNAQTQALDFYTRYGFVAEGEVFFDAGIAHLRMKRRLDEGDHGAGTDVAQPGE